jgi:hypothetical protein
MAAAQRSAHGDTLHSESLSDCEAEAAKKATGTKRRPSGSRLRYLHVSSNFAIIDQSIFTCSSYIIVPTFPCRKGGIVACLSRVACA